MCVYFIGAAWCCAFALLLRGVFVSSSFSFFCQVVAPVASASVFNLRTAALSRLMALEVYRLKPPPAAATTPTMTSIPRIPSAAAAAAAGSVGDALRLVSEAPHVNTDPRLFLQTP